jgi:AcrR family transcriptional regulator
MLLVKQAYHHKDLRNALVDEALAILAESGPGAITLRELARRLGVTHTAPYAHFADKKTLLEAVADEGFDRLTQCLTDAGASENDPHRRFVSHGIAYVQFARDNPNLYRLMFVDPELGHDPDCAWSEQADRAFDLLLNELSELGVPQGTEIHDVACGIWSLLHGVAMLEIDGRLHGKRTFHGKAALADGDAVVLLMSKYLLDGLHAARAGS